MPTTGISLVREHTEQMQLPRFLWVPFPLGRPFGAPGEPDFQRRVLRTALALLEREDGPVVLEDFPDDAPAGSAEGDATWSCPVVFESPQMERSALVGAVLDEMARLAPWYEVCRAQRGVPALALSGLDFDATVAWLGRFAEGEHAPVPGVELPVHEALRLSCDELRNWYLDAAQGQPGRASAERLRDWFWRETAAARLIGAATARLTEHPEPMVRVLAARALVPREYMDELLTRTEEPSGD